MKSEPLPVPLPVPVPESAPSLLRLNAATVGVLVARDLRRFFRQRSRIVGALVQPLIFWLVIGSGLSGSFTGGDYVSYFYPGIVMLVILFTSIFTTMSVIEDRQRGFLQAVLVAPASRASLVLGKTLGGVAIAMVQAAIFLALAPLAGYALSTVNWPALAAVLMLAGVGLASVGFGIAWWLNSTQGYHVIMSVLLIPLWILSGAMFPSGGAAGWLKPIMAWNPMSYAVAGIRGALAGNALARDLVVVGLFAALALGWATFMCARRRP